MNLSNGWTDLVTLAALLGTLVTGVITLLLLRDRRHLPVERMTRLELSGATLAVVALALVAAHEAVILILGMIAIWSVRFPQLGTLVRLLVIGMSILSIAIIVGLRLRGRRTLEARLNPPQRLEE